MVVDESIIPDKEIVRPIDPVPLEEPVPVSETGDNNQQIQFNYFILLVMMTPLAFIGLLMLCQFCLRKRRSQRQIRDLKVEMEKFNEIVKRIQVRDEIQSKGVSSSHMTVGSRCTPMCRGLLVCLLAPWP